MEHILQYLHQGKGGELKDEYNELCNILIKRVNSKTFTILMTIAINIVAITSNNN